MFVNKSAPSNLAAADDKLRAEKACGGRPVSMPKKAAWSTMEAILAKVAKKSADRKRKADERQEHLWDLFRKGLRADATELSELEGQEARDVKLGKLAVKLKRDTTFPQTFSSLLAMEGIGVTLKEAWKHDLTHVVHSLRDHQVLPLSVLAQCILRRWTD